MQVLTPGDSRGGEHGGVSMMSGCCLKNSRSVLQAAKRLRLNVVGIRWT